MRAFEQEEGMASLLIMNSQQQEQQGPNEIKKELQILSSANTQLLTCSSSDHLLHHHHHKISSHDPMSRSLDASIAISSCRTNNRVNNHLVDPYNPAVNRDSISNALMGWKQAAPDTNHANMVPFKWEEAPGKPIDTSLVPCNNNTSSLQLPPKLQCQSPLHSIHKNSLNPKTPAYNHHEISPPSIRKPATPFNQSLFRPSPNKEIIRKLCRYMLKTASCSGHTPLRKFISHSWHTPPCIEFSSTTLHHHYQHQSDKLSFNDRFFFDRFSPKDLRHCASMDSILPIFDASDREEEFVSRKALNFLAMEEEHEEAESNSTSSSPWQPLSFHEREASPYCQWQPAAVLPIKVYGAKLRHDEHDDDDDDEGFHDFFSTSSSRKPSQRTDCDAMESASTSPSPWYLDFSPEEEEVHVERKGSKLRVRLVALIKLKRVISRFKRRREGANHQVESTMWSPTLATYLYNEKEEETQKISTPESSSGLKQSHGSCGEDDGGRSEMGSNRLHIDSNYYLPSKIRTHVMNSDDDYYYYYSDEESLGRRPSPYRMAEKEEAERQDMACLRQKLSLREQLAEFEADDPSPACVMHKAPLPSSCKGMCKVRQTVKVLASTIRLILVHTEIGKKKRGQRSSESYIKPTLISTHATTPCSRKSSSQKPNTRHFWL